MKYPVISANPEVQALYERCRREGTDHNLAVMFAERRPPGCVTNKVFLRGFGKLRDQFQSQEDFNVVLQGARAKGYEPSSNDVYLSAIADDIGDPKAFVKDDARGHIKKVCEERGWNCDGLVKVEQKRTGDPARRKPRSLSQAWKEKRNGVQ